MKKSFLVGLLSVCVLSMSYAAAPAAAPKAVAAEATKREPAKAGREADWGVGGQLGTLTGVNTQYFFTRELSGVGVVGYDFRDEGVGLLIDGHYNLRDLVDISKGALNFYSGAGFKVTNGDSKTRFLIRVPLGVNYFLSTQPLDVFFELVPEYQVNHNSGAKFEFALGARYYF
ncbi:MAG: hypothetical protein HYS98_06975 [Deltaproteobacteria bacterium]|nr:hypothetical protein [Deltaproteobacteria bacterium]